MDLNELLFTLGLFVKDNVLNPTCIDWYEEVGSTEIITWVRERALSLWWSMWAGHLIKSWWRHLNYLSEVSSVWSQGFVCSSWKEKLSPPSLPQMSRCISHWNHFTQSHVVDCEVEIRPTTTCALSAACEGGVSIWELCCWAVEKQKKNTLHNTTRCYFWSNSLKKGLLSFYAGGDKHHSLSSWK